MQKGNSEKPKYEIGESIVYNGKEIREVISFIPATGKYLLSGIGNPVKVDEIKSIETKRT